MRTSSRPALSKDRQATLLLHRLLVGEFDSLVAERLAHLDVNEVPDINRVTLDVTSKPPGTIEWE